MENPAWPVLDRTTYLIEHAYGPQDQGQVRLPSGTDTVLLIVRCGPPPALGRDTVIAQF